MMLSQMFPLVLFFITNQGGAESTACKDLSPVCYAADKNYCNEASLRTFCKVTCGLCPKAEICEDLDPLCKRSKIHCSSNSNIAKTCPKTCGLCQKRDSSCECGIANEPSRKKRGTNRIVGGRDALKHKYPWIVSIKMKFGMYYNQCGGSIINTRYILTAGHCTYKQICKDPYREDDYWVTVAEHNDQSINDNIKGVTETLKVKKIIRHEEYCSNPRSRTSFNNDIALLLLPNDLDLTHKELGIVCLPEKASSTYEGKTVWVAGWGSTAASPHLIPSTPMTGSLQEVSFEVHNDCRNYKYSSHITGNMFCAGDKEAVKDACGGDSGGPLMYKDQNNRYIQIGIVSFGPPGKNCTGMGVYTVVSHYLDWIKRNTRDGKCQ